MAASPMNQNAAVTGVQSPPPQGAGDQYTAIKIKQNPQQEQIDKLKHAHKLRSSQGHSPDPLTFLNQPNSTSSGSTGVTKNTDHLVKLVVDADGNTTVGNYKLGKSI